MPDRRLQEGGRRHALGAHALTFHPPIHPPPLRPCLRSYHAQQGLMQRLQAIQSTEGVQSLAKELRDG